MGGKVRIIGGQWRGRRLQVPDRAELRPTPDRIRETLFNWLAWSIAGSRCLDLFAGSGALGLEAASRGAKEVWLVERDKQIVQLLRTELMTLKAEQVQLKHADAFKFLATPATPFDVVFLDPPFGHDWLRLCCLQLEQSGWLSPHAHIYLEAERTLTELVLPDNWQIIKQQQAGHVKCFLAQRGTELA